MSSARTLAALVSGTLVFGMLLSGCDAPPRAHTAFDQRVDFANYRTFALVHPNRPVPAAGGMDPFTLHRMRQMTFAVLKQRGLRPVAYADAQLRVAVFGEPRVRTEVIPASTWAPYPRHYYGPEVRTFETVMIEIDIMDSPRGAVIWYGRAETITGAEASDEELWPLVQTVLGEFPPEQSLRE